MAIRTHVVLPGSKRGKDRTAERIGAIDPKEKIQVTLNLAGPKLPGADEFVGRTLSPQELAQKFGASTDDAERVQKSLRRYGLKVDEISLATRTMRVSGTAESMEAAFKPRMALMHSARQGDYRGREGALMIPNELKGIVTGVFGLDTRRMAKRKSAVPMMLAHSTVAPLTPTDLEARYNFPAGDAAGQKIVIAEFGGGYFASDTAAFCGKFGRPVPSVHAVGMDNTPAYTLQQILALPPQQRSQQLEMSVEVMMDAEIVAGLCPKAEIAVYFSSFDQKGWVDLIDKAIGARPVALSVSWGLSEDDPGWSQNAITAISDRLNAARLLGITTCVSSGDDGSGDQMRDGKAHVDFPASSPYVLGVGGTMLASSQEVAWWESPGRRTGNGGGASGGGVSGIFARPAWQAVNVKSINSTKTKGRVVPDVSALAGEPLYDLIFAGHPMPNGGTSASAPLWASLIARMAAKLPTAKQQRFLTPLLYKNGTNGRPIGAEASRDITKGNNASHPLPGKGYKAGAGYDAVTGWGVPDGAVLLAALGKI